MSTIRGTSQDIWDSPTDSSRCLIPCPTNTPSHHFPFWKITPSRDGTRCAIPMQITPEECRLYTWTVGNDTPEISEPCLAITDLHPLSKEEFSFLQHTDEGWTAVTHQEPWDMEAEFAWNLIVSDQGVTACQTQDDRRYTPIVDATPWSTSYESSFGLTLSTASHRSAAVVQTVPLTEGDLTTFLSGCFTLGTEEGPWPGHYIGAFNPAISADGTRTAVDARITQYDYTIIVDGQPWSSAWPSVWGPIIHPDGKLVCAPVKEPEGWTLACDGKPFWPGHYVQLWEPAFSPNGQRIAAVIAPHFGIWTLALDGVPWKSRVDGYLTKPVFSPCGSRVGCTGSHKGRAVILIDDCLMSGNFDKAWDPIFSQYGKHVAVKIKKGPWFGLLLNGAEVHRPFLWMADPFFTPDGNHLMICGVEKEGSHYIYTREFIALN